MEGEFKQGAVSMAHLVGRTCKELAADVSEDSDDMRELPKANERHPQYVRGFAAGIEFIAQALSDAIAEGVRSMTRDD